MAQLSKKLTNCFRAVSPNKLTETAKECRDAAYRYRACSEKLDEAAICFEDGNFETGYEYLKKAEAALDKTP